MVYLCEIILVVEIVNVVPQMAIIGMKLLRSIPKGRCNPSTQEQIDNSIAQLEKIVLELKTTTKQEITSKHLVALEPQEEVTISPQDLDKNNEKTNEIPPSHINTPDSVVEGKKGGRDVLSTGNTEEETNNMIEEDNEPRNSQSKKVATSEASICLTLPTKNSKETANEYSIQHPIPVVNAEQNRPSCFYTENIKREHEEVRKVKSSAEMLPSRYILTTEPKNCYNVTQANYQEIIDNLMREAQSSDNDILKYLEVVKLYYAAGDHKTAILWLMQFFNEGNDNKDIHLVLAFLFKTYGFNKEAASICKNLKIFRNIKEADVSDLEYLQELEKAEKSFLSQYNKDFVNLTRFQINGQNVQFLLAKMCLKLKYLQHIIPEDHRDRANSILLSEENQKEENETKEQKYEDLEHDCDSIIYIYEKIKASEGDVTILPYSFCNKGDVRP